jgi:hypothetical protein
MASQPRRVVNHDDGRSRHRREPTGHESSPAFAQFLLRQVKPNTVFNYRNDNLRAMLHCALFWFGQNPAKTPKSR